MWRISIRRRFNVKYNIPPTEQKLLDFESAKPMSLIRSGNNVHVPTVPIVHSDNPQVTLVLN